jgi:hypothetical protein
VDQLSSIFGECIAKLISRYDNLFHGMGVMDSEQILVTDLMKDLHTVALDMYVWLKISLTALH